MTYMDYKNKIDSQNTFHTDQFGLFDDLEISTSHNYLQKCKQGGMWYEAVKHAKEAGMTLQSCQEAAIARIARPLADISKSTQLTRTVAVYFHEKNGTDYVAFDDCAHTDHNILVHRLRTWYEKLVKDYNELASFKSDPLYMNYMVPRLFNDSQQKLEFSFHRSNPLIEATIQRAKRSNRIIRFHELTTKINIRHPSLEDKEILQAILPGATAEYFEHLEPHHRQLIVQFANLDEVSDHDPAHANISGVSLGNFNSTRNQYNVINAGTKLNNSTGVCRLVTTDPINALEYWYRLKALSEKFELVPDDFKMRTQLAAMYTMASGNLWDPKNKPVLEDSRLHEEIELRCQLKAMDLDHLFDNTPLDVLLQFEAKFGDRDEKLRKKQY